MSTTSRSLAHLFVLLLCLALAGPAAAALSPELQRGHDWLAAQVKSDGTLHGEQGALGTPLQARMEALLSLKALGGSAPVSLASTLAADTAEDTEYLARRVLALKAAGRDVTALVTLLAQRQNADGGFGSAALDLRSDPVDTAWALAAFGAKAPGDAAIVRAAVNYLIEVANNDGGFSPVWGGGSDLYATATALIALQTHSGAAAAAPAALSAARQWLLTQQRPGGYGDSFPNATAILALQAVSPDAAIYAAARDALAAAQGQNGSWGDDPFVTALALRALFNAGQLTTTGRLAATVIDADTGAPIADALLQLVEAPASSAASGSDGVINLSGISPGIYTVQIAAAGYSREQIAAVTITAGNLTQLGMVALRRALESASVRGRVSDGGSGEPLSGVTVTLSDAAAAVTTAATDAEGQYLLSGLAPGAVTLNVAKSGYAPVTAAAQLVAGQTLLFSPSLYAAGTTPGAVTVTGQVVDAATGSPIAGATITLGGTSATSNAQGAFELTGLSAGAFAATVSATGYHSASLTGVLVAGSNPLGLVKLAKPATSSTLTGTVTDPNGTPLAGVKVAATGAATAKEYTTDQTGRYLLSGLTDLLLTVEISAPGYVTQTVRLQLTQHAEFRQDFVLQYAPSELSLRIDSVAPASAGGGAEVTVRVTVSNLGTHAANGLLQLQVLNGGTVVSYNLSVDENGQPAGELHFPGNSEVAGRVIWNTAQHAPGRYGLIARLIEPGSAGYQEPFGHVLAEAAGSVEVLGSGHFSGSVTANPPILRAGLNTPVKLSALIQNDGNQPMTAQSYTLRAVNTGTGVVAMTQQQQAPSLAVQALHEMTFSDWVPEAGEYRVELTGTDPGLASTTIYVGDSAAATFAVDKVVVPVGTQQVRGTIQVTGQDVTSGTISDPLAAPIRAAIVKAVAINDQLAHDWTISQTCQGCHVETQALVGGELNRRFAAANPLHRRAIFNATGLSLQANGTLSAVGESYYPLTLQMLGLWALHSYHDRASILGTFKRATDRLVANQSAAGDWTVDDWRGWWRSGQIPATAFSLKSVIDSLELLGQAAPESVRYHALNRIDNVNLPSNYAGLMRDSAGNFYYTGYFGHTDGVVMQVKADGSAGMIWHGLNEPRSVVEEGGLLVVATIDGIAQLNRDGSVTFLNTVRGLTDLSRDQSGRLFAVGSSDNTIYAVGEQWVLTPWYTGSPLNVPYKLSFVSGGDAIVTNVGNKTLVKIDKDKKPSMLVEEFGGAWPLHVLEYGDSWLVSCSSGVYRFNQAWEGERLTFDRRVDQLLLTPDQRLLAVGQSSVGIFELVSTPQDLSGSLTQYAAAIDKATAWLMGVDLSGSDSNLDRAHQLTGFAEAYAYYKSRDPGRAQQLRERMGALDADLRSRQRADGGWGVETGWESDALVTAQVGMALDYLDPSPADPAIRKAVTWLLSRQQPNGTWRSENGVLGWTYEAATTWVAIWLPTLLDRLGGIDTELTASFPANVVLSRPDLAPTSSLDNADGSKTYVWNMVGVTVEGRGVNFDLSLLDMAANEVRPVAVDAHLTFRNSFNEHSVEQAIDIPRVTASSYLTLGVTTDRTRYPAGMPAVITAQVTNTGAALNEGSVRLEIHSPDGSLVADLGSLPFSGLAPGASTLLTRGWDTGGTLSETGYFVEARLYDSFGSQAGTARTQFDIVGSGDGGGELTVHGSVQVDKGSYLPSETVNIESRVGNLAVNSVLRGVSAVTTLLDPQGAIVLTRSEAVEGLPPGGTLSYRYTYPLAFAVPGNYALTFEVRAANGARLAQASTAFVVQSSADSGSGLAGTLSVTPREVPQGEPVALGLEVHNRGNAPFTGLPLKLSVIEPRSAQVLAEFSHRADLAIGAIYSGSERWVVTGSVGTVYVGVLSAQVGGEWLTLDQQNFSVGTPRVMAALEVDKAIFLPSETVQIVATITNHSPDAALLNLRAVTTLADPQGATVLMREEAIAKLPAAGTQPYGYAYPLAYGAPGRYTATLQVLDAQGALLNLASKQFTVLSTAESGDGLTGTLAAAPTRVALGDPVSLAVTAGNQGNAAVANLPLTLTLSDARGQTVKRFEYAPSLAIGGAFKADERWTATGQAGASVSATLSATVAGNTLTLAQAGIELTPPLRLTAATDRESYPPSATVILDEAVVSLTSVAGQPDLSVKTTVTSPQGATVFSRSEPPTLLAAGATLPYRYSYPLNYSPPGRYGVAVQVVDPLGQIVARVETAFSVLSTAQTGDGLSGSLTAAPRQVPMGDPVALGVAVDNQGNSAVPGLPLTLVVADAAGRTLDEFSYRADLPLGGRFQTDERWTTRGEAGATLSVTLSAQVGDKRLALAKEQLTLTAPLTASLATDRDRYPPSATVTLDETVTSLTTLATQSNLTVKTTVSDPQGRAAFSWQETLASLAAGATQPYRYRHPVNYAPPGRYGVAMEVLEAGGKRLALRETAFTVLSTAESGDGLSGTLRAEPQLVPSETEVNLALTVIDAGNSPVTDLPLTVTLTDPAGQEVKRFDYRASLTQGGRFEEAARWVAIGPVGTTYTATLSARIGETALKLAETRFTVTPNLELIPSVPRIGRVLGLAGCPQTVLAGDEAGVNACTAAHAAAMDRLLTQMGVHHLVTDDAEGFRKALRSGLYNVTWISGRPFKLKDDLAAEVRESVFRGDGLLIDGDHDERNKRLDEAVGIVYRGKLGSTNPAVTFTSPLLGSGTLAVTGRALKLELAGGRAEATVPGQGNQPALPAIVRRDFGFGHGVLFGFELLSSMEKEPRWQPVFAAALGHVTPAPADTPLVVGGLGLLRTEVVNRGAAVEASLVLTLPEGARSLLGLPAPTAVQGREVSWRFALAEHARSPFLLAFGLPWSAGSYTLEGRLSTTVNGVSEPYGEPFRETVTVTDATRVGPAADAALRALPLTDKAEQRARDKALKALADAQAALARGNYESAIGALVEAIEQVRAITSVEVAGIRRSLDLILQEAQGRWAAQ